MMRAASLISLLLVVANVVAAEIPARIPFAIPIALESLASNQRAAEPSAAPAQLRLRATLLSGERSLVILDGAILTIGEEYLGYRLLSVTEGEAVLRKNGASIRLSVDDDNE